MMEAFMLIAAIGLFVTVWWAMVEAQTRIPGVNEPDEWAVIHSKKGREDLWDELIQLAKDDDRPCICPSCGDTEAWITWKGEVLCDVCMPGQEW